MKILENRICDPSDPEKYEENSNWLLGLFDHCSKCNHPKGWHDTELWSKDGSCTGDYCNCKGFEK